MRNLAECSGAWTGFWIQGPTRGWMRIDMTIRNDRLLGDGSDQSGSFKMFGTYDLATDVVQIDKNYPWVFVEYTGKWDGQMIAGQWKLSMPDDITEDDFEADMPGTGVFEMWPLDGEAEELSLKNLMEEPVGVG